MRAKAKARMRGRDVGRIYDTVNNGVYKAGFATSQAAYEAAFFEPISKENSSGMSRVMAQADIRVQSPNVRL